MSANKRITDLSDYTSILPYASELFGVYQPLIGWRSKRQVRRFVAGSIFDQLSRFRDFAQLFTGRAHVDFNQDHFLEGARIEVGAPQPPLAREASGSVLLAAVAQRLRASGVVPLGKGWNDFINEDALMELLNVPVFETYRDEYQRRWMEAIRQPGFSPELLEPGD